MGKPTLPKTRDPKAKGSMVLKSLREVRKPSKVSSPSSKMGRRANRTESESHSDLENVENPSLKRKIKTKKATRRHVNYRSIKRTRARRARSCQLIRNARALTLRQMKTRASSRITTQLPDSRSAPRKRRLDDSRSSNSQRDDTPVELSFDELSNSQPTERNNYEVKSIHDYYVDTRNKANTMYLVSWKNYGRRFNTWEPAQNMTHCPEILSNFYEKRLIDVFNLKESLIKKWGRFKGALRQMPLPPDPRPLWKSAIHVLETKLGVSRNTYIGIYLRRKKSKKTLTLSNSKVYEAIRDLYFGEFDGNIDNIKYHLITLAAEYEIARYPTVLKEWEDYMNSISKGKPAIIVENEMDYALPPKSFTFINDYKLPRKFPTETPAGCKCKLGCSKTSSCCTQGYEFAYDRKKRLRKDFEVGQVIYECNSQCTCNRSCINRVVQSDTESLEGKRFSIFRTESKGWGMKTLTPIQRGEFVGLYVGEIISYENSERRAKHHEGCTYLLDLTVTSEEETKFVIDAFKCANASRFINHSCVPNLSSYYVCVESINKYTPKIAFFANRSIKAMEELTFDYDQNFPPSEDKPSGSKNQKKERKCYDLARTKCFCKSKNCREKLLHLRNVELGPLRTKESQI